MLTLHMTRSNHSFFPLVFIRHSNSFVTWYVSKHYPLVIHLQSLSDDLIKDVGHGIGKEWMQLGKKLGLNSEALTNIHSHHFEKEQKQAYIDAANEMLEKWFNEGPGPKTWKRVTDVLSTMKENERDLADGLRAKYNCF